jgi:hypothetical protein
MRTRELVAVAAAFAAASLLLTLPLVLDPARKLPSDLGDTLLTTWIIGWDADRLQHGLRGVWDAPIFFPYRDTLAFSETLLGLAVFVAPVYWITANAVLTYNTAFLLSFFVAGFGMYLLARELSGSPAAAFVAGIYFAFGPFRMAQIAHIQMVATGWIPIALWGLHRYFSTQRFRWLAVWSAAWALQMLSNTYVGYFIAVPIAVVVADALWRARDERTRVLIHLAAASLLLGAVLAPTGLAYYRARATYHHVRSADELAAHSADLRAYVVGKNTIGIWRWLPTAVSMDPEKELFPGVFALCLAGIGFWTGARDPIRRRWAIVYGVVVVAAVALSLGPRVRVWGTVVTTHGPYGWLLGIVPGMDGMRVPARFAIIVIAALSVLIAFGVEWMMRRAGRRIRPLLIAGCVGIVVSEGWATPMVTVPYRAHGRPQDRDVASWLADRAPGALLHLPMRGDARVLDHQFMTLVHGRPIVNGYSGYATPLLEFLDAGFSPMYDVARFPAAVRMLRSLGVRYVLVHPDDYDEAAKAAGVPDRMIRALRGSSQIAKEASLPQVVAFELQPWDAAGTAAPATPIDARELTASVSEAADRIPNLFDRDRDSRWIAGIGGQDGSSWVRLQLAHPADVARVTLQIAERSMADYPRVLRIEGEDAAGRSHVLYDGSPYPELAAAIVRDGRYPDIAVALPHNDTATLWIRQTAASRASWSIHELRLWRYDSSGGIR